ncbi:MAG: hypothetical protein AB8G96_00900 [Phycisphaerales bacterium]
MTSGENAGARGLTAGLWGLFCACSWTWCIGMYLPKIMLERFGWTGFLVFAVPNILGCAALGYVLKTRAPSQRMTDGHRSAMMWFSAITIAFHSVFAVHLLGYVWSVDMATAAAVAAQAGDGQAAALYGQRVGNALNPGSAGIGIGVLTVVGLILSRLGDRGWLVATVLTYATSLAALVLLILKPNLLGGVPAIENPMEIGIIAPLIVAGFLLCPYLDFTFHRAHRAAPGTHAFGVFGVGFGLMLVLTCILWVRDAPALTTIALVHLGAQATFTVGAHLRELREAARTTWSAALWMLLPLISGGAFIGLQEAMQRPIGDDMYLRFLAAYGLVLPAYVLVFIVARIRVRQTMVSTIALLAVCAGLAPFYEFGFIGRQPLLMLVPLAVLVFWVAWRWMATADRPSEDATALPSGG